MSKSKSTSALQGKATDWPDLDFEHPGNGQPSGMRWVQRLRNDLRLALVCLFGFLGVVAIAPFAVFRLVAGDILIGLFDSLVVLALAGGAIFAWHTNRVEPAGNFMALIACLGSVLAVHLLDLSFLWVFSTLLATFVVAERRFATFITLLMIAAVGYHEPVFANMVERMTFFAVSGMVTLFALIFATRTAHQNEQLRKMASIDPLTGVANRRVMKADLRAAALGYPKNDQPYALGLLDLDHFKQVNDIHGHEAGDQVLIDMVRIVQEAIRRGDKLYRFGGEEFVVLFSGTDAPGLQVVTEKILKAINDQLVGPAGPVTLSIGATELSPGEDWSSWLARADKALYEAKRTGRNRTVIAPPDPRPSQ